MQVADVEADVINYKEPANTGDYLNYVVTDFQVTTRYESINRFTLIVKRLDDVCGWTEDLEVSLFYTTSKRKEIIKVGPSATAEKELNINTAEVLEKSWKPVALLPSYRLAPCPPPSCISRDEFNTIFKSDIAPLPGSLYAVGLHAGKTYVYNDVRTMWFEIIAQWRHIISVALTFTHIRTFYFIVSSSDGYLEEMDTANRVVPQKMEGGQSLHPLSYPVWHSKRWIFCQSAPVGIPYTIGMIDRHALHLCASYHHLRSFHAHMPFHEKKSKIIYGGRIDRGSTHNFVQRKDITLNPRRLFYSDAVPKTNVVCLENVWIKDKEMATYKYILDIDGHGSTWDGTAWKLNSGSVMFKSESRWRQWFYDDFKPWMHYIPIKDDFSDLDEKFHWCEDHLDECLKIIENAKALFQTAYRFHNMVAHTVKLIELMV